MSNESKALELAAELENNAPRGALTDSKAAAELRRQHAEIKSLRAQLAQQALQPSSRMSLAVIGNRHFGNPIPQAWYSAAKELLADACASLQQAPVAQGEPVAEYRGVTEDGHYLIKAMAPLSRGMLFYTRPQQASEPMTQEQIKEKWFEICSLNVPSLNKALMLARAVERHHQIKGKQ